jgi:hypothetical protein
MSAAKPKTNDTKKSTHREGHEHRASKKPVSESDSSDTKHRHHKESNRLKPEGSDHHRDKKSTHRESEHRHRPHKDNRKEEVQHKPVASRALGKPVTIELMEGSFHFKTDVEYKNSGGTGFSPLGPTIEVPKDFPGSKDLDSNSNVNLDLDATLIGSVGSNVSGIQFIILLDDAPINKGALISCTGGRFNLAYSVTIPVPVGKHSKINLGWKPVSNTEDPSSQVVAIRAATSPTTDSGIFWYHATGTSYK